MIQGFETWNTDFIDAQYRIMEKKPLMLSPGTGKFFFKDLTFGR